MWETWRKVPEKWCAIPTRATGLESEDRSLRPSFAACGLGDLGQVFQFSEPQFPHVMGHGCLAPPPHDFLGEGSAFQNI